MVRFGVEVMKLNLQIAICDDEPIIANDIKEKLLQYKPDYVIDLYLSGKELLGTKKEYDLIFLDIEMPEISGMEVATELRNREYEGNLVFLTSHTEFMPDAFKVKAFRFLQKPIVDSAFEEAVDEAEKEIMNHKKILVHTTDGTRLLSINDIIYFETVRNYTYIHMKQREIETRKTLREWMDIIGDEHFYQVHKSYVIALRYIETVDSDGVIMKYANVKIPVSRRKMKEVKESYFAYVKKYAMYI